MSRMNSLSEAEWVVIKALYRDAYRQALKMARGSFEELGQPAGYAMVRGPGFGVAVRLEHAYGGIWSKERLEAPSKKLAEGGS